MKKNVLCALALLGVVGTLASCGGNEGEPSSNGGASSNSTNGGTSTAYKLGLGQAISLTKGDDDIITQIDITFASVVYQGEKVVSTYIDVVQLPIVYTAADGDTEESYAYKDTANQVKNAGDKNVETKKELKERYGMSVIPGVTEWYVQAGKFEDWATGKNFNDLTVTKGEVDDNHSEEWTNNVTGCTILVDDFVTAMKNAKNHSVDFTSDEAPKAVVGVLVGAAGSQIDVNFASVANVGNKAAASVVDVYQIPLKEGVLDADNKAVKNKLDGTEFASKFELKENYGMSVIPGVTEWYVQAEKFQEWAMGKTSEELNGFTVGQPDDSHSEEWTNNITGCTMSVGDFVAAIQEGMTNKRA